MATLEQPSDSTHIMTNRAKTLFWAFMSRVARLLMVGKQVAQTLLSMSTRHIRFLLRTDPAPDIARLKDQVPNSPWTTARHGSGASRFAMGQGLTAQLASALVEGSHSPINALVGQAKRSCRVDRPEARYGAVETRCTHLHQVMQALIKSPTVL